MVIAGIDEAGYGPLLGPLLVGCSAFAVEGTAPPADALPCLWDRLRGVVSRHRDKHARKLHIEDSKSVYSPSQGLRELERSVLCMAGTLGAPADLDALVKLVAPHAAPDLAGYTWYRRDPDERFPRELDAVAVRLMTNALNVEMDKSRARLVHLAARIIPERQFNSMVNATRNKASMLFSQVAIHLDHLLTHQAAEGLVVFCDRQGGREHYGHLLRLMFEQWELTVEFESDKRSDYVLRSGPRQARVIFAEKAESQCLATALASMLAKYLRETLMGRFNAWWARQAPGVAPTAGYYSDGVRFLQDTQQRRIELGIPDDQLVRQR